MPPSSKRPQRTRREPVNHVDIPDSSPSRPAKRRKKVVEPVEEPEIEPEITLPRDRSGIDLNDEELISAVVPHLALPEHPVQASQDHANVIHERHNKEGVQAYAKLTGKDWTFYVKRLKNNIGRPPENANPAPAGQLAESVLPDDQPDTGVHIDLGPSKMVSRQHAQVYYDSDTECWNILVQGRNGIKIDNEILRRTQTHKLISGEVVEIGGVEMMFVLPEQDGSLKVHRRYLQRAGLVTVEEEEESNIFDLPNSARNSTAGASLGQNGGSGPLAIAPAPPNYQRPGTPASARSKGPYSARKSPGYTNGGTILLSTDDVDLSLDSNSHIKPSFSYAQMISQAIFQTEDERLTLNGIYTYIMEKYAYYRHQHGGGWQNSIRHNLSLNKSFNKIARATDEPGKGMKWCIVPEARDEMIRSCNRGGRGGHRGSSAPNSPANLGTLGRPSGDGLSNPDSTRKLSPYSHSPPLSSYPSGVPQYTPDRPGQLSRAREQLPGDGSPLPRHRRPNTNAYGLSDNTPGSPPALSSSYLQDETGSLVTPAPHRVQPYLAPPSTAQRPSQHMPTSSPAPFWKYADQTPMRGFDSSPIKSSALPPVPASSSPVPARKVSPVRISTPARQEASNTEEVEEEDVGFDLTKGFQSIGSYHSIPPPSNGLAALASAVNSRS
ncbi:Fork-head transcriptional regulator 2 [Hyphodiscus hymeniophilus]|uniref:Fork-head transcriptional regulator 2 n=1 Tax=Hyphodiscus hymeniophilus TaxID=353542 RepID=A0A9P7AUE5_9HELO|nr:Fork-head transcriptional regulator 2 [Hyphodiscus hymeniophilus]